MTACVIGAGPCGLAALKNLLQAGLRDVVCFEESDGIGGNWAFTDDPGRAGVPDCTHIISSKRLSSFDDFPMPPHYPDFPSHRQMLAYFTGYATQFRLLPHIRLGHRVERCELGDDGRWTVRVSTTDGTTVVERFDHLLICSGHHRQAFIPDFPGTFSGALLHSSAYKRAEEFRGKRVLIVGAGNSAADIAVDLARQASYTAISMRAGAYFIPKLMFGKPTDAAYAFWRNKLPRPLLRSALRLWLRLTVGRWQDYGLAAPAHPPLEKRPTMNSAILEALRHGRVVARPGIHSFDGHTVHFTDGTAESFDAVVMGTGFRTTFPFLPDGVVDSALYPQIFFIGMVQPLECIWRLADYQARAIGQALSSSSMASRTACSPLR
ncbi:MAG TPA: NAD(P)-binding domain-containing protein [Candidatus Limnocylindrales bacterium]